MTIKTETIHSIPALLTDDLRNMVHEKWGPGIELTGYQPLTRRASEVGRLTMRNPGKKNIPSSVIVKHIWSECYPSANLAYDKYDFAEEMLAYRFIEQHAPDQSFKARLETACKNGIMIFQDLGPEGNPVPRSFDYLIPRIAASLVKLHTQCDVTKFEKYLAMRKEAGLGGLMDDQRRYGLVKQMMRFDLGKEALVKLISKREGDQLALTLADELCGIKERVENPRQFFSLIHDDLGNARQTFEVGNEIYLLDFEYSKYTHSLLEFGKLLIGKFEWTIETDICLWTNPGFPLQLPLEYRRIMEKDSGIFYDDDEWNRGLADALIYWSICLLGRLTYMDEKQPLVGSVKQNANGVINRLVQLLQDIPAETCMETVGKRFISLRL